MNFHADHLLKVFTDCRLLCDRKRVHLVRTEGRSSFQVFGAILIGIIKANVSRLALECRAEPWLSKEHTFLSSAFTSVLNDHLVIAQSFFDQFWLKKAADLVIQID